MPASCGRLSVDQFDVDQDPVEVKKRTAYVPDDPQLFNELTVAQHFGFVASSYDVPQWQQLMEELLELFELSRKIDSRAADLSRGMRQKLALGCAYLFQPKALLLDEPMSALDDETREQIYALLTSIQSKTGVTVLHVTHNKEEARRLADKLLEFDHGQVITDILS